MTGMISVAVIGIVAALAGLVAFAPVPAAAQEDYAGGYLVIVPSLPDVGDTVQAVGLGLGNEPQHGIEWTHHFARKGEPCGNSGGIVHGDEYGTAVELVACIAGDAVVTLYAVETGEIADQKVVIIGGRPEATLSVAGDLRVRPRVPVPVTITFSESVTEFTPDDITITNGTMLANPIPIGEGVGTSFYAFSVIPDYVYDVSLYMRSSRAYSLSRNLPNKPSNELILAPYDDDANGVIDVEEAVNAISDFFDDYITYDEAVYIIRLYFSGG